MTDGKGIVPIGPLGGWVVVVSQALVLFIFSSVSLQHDDGQLHFALRIKRWH